MHSRRRLHAAEINRRAVRHRRKAHLEQAGQGAHIGGSDRRFLGIHPGVLRTAIELHPVIPLDCRRLGRSYGSLCRGRGGRRLDNRRARVIRRIGRRNESICDGWLAGLGSRLLNDRRRGNRCWRALDAYQTTRQRLVILNKKTRRMVYLFLPRFINGWTLIINTNKSYLFDLISRLINHYLLPPYRCSLMWHPFFSLSIDVLSCGTPSSPSPSMFSHVAPLLLPLDQCSLMWHPIFSLSIDVLSCGTPSSPSPSMFSHVAPHLLPLHRCSLMWHSIFSLSIGVLSCGTPSSPSPSVLSHVAPHLLPLHRCSLMWHSIFSLSIDVLSMGRVGVGSRLSRAVVKSYTI